MDVFRGILDVQCLTTLPYTLDVACSNLGTWDLQYWIRLSFIFQQFFQANIGTVPLKGPRRFPCTSSPVHYSLTTLLYPYTNTASLDETRMCFCKSQLTHNLYYLRADVHVVFTPTSTQNIAYLIFKNCLMCKVIITVRTYVVWKV
jgi:hypothetical protein